MSLRPVFVVVVLLAICALPSSGLWQSGTPIPRGRTAANEATRKAEQVEPPAPAAHSVSAADIRKQADELLSLAQEVHTDTQRATEGLISKDLKDKLRRMEKLSKKLRDELGL
ncbi:MAG TPA: hypothetical protein VFB04_09755 [Terriglobales bacterium]|nr:hypothetical protein [Terriglobales bacterium]